MNRRHPVAAAAAILLLTSCGGSSSSSPSTGLPPTQTAQLSARATLVLSIPRTNAPAGSSLRKPSYVSPATQSVGVSVDGGAATFTNISPSSPGCTGTTPTAPYNCTISIGGPTGPQPVAITAYDRPSGAGNKLSANSIDVTFVSGQNPTVPIVLSGVPHGIAVISGSSTFLPSGVSGFSTLSGAVEPITVVAVDADNNFIVGPGAPLITVNATPIAPAQSTSVTISTPNTSFSNAFAVKDTAYETVTLNVSAVPLPGAGGQPITQAFTLLSSTLVSTFSGATISQPAPGFSDGAAATAQYAYPAALAMANGNIYLADRNNCRIREIVASGSNAGTASTLAGTACSGPSGALYHPTGITYDTKDGNAYITDFAHCQIQQMSPSGALTVIAGTGTCGYANGSGSTAQFDYPDAITYDKSADALFVSDAFNCAIREVQTTAPYAVSDVAGNQSACRAHIYTSTSTYTGSYYIPYCYGCSGPPAVEPANAIVQPGGITNDGAGNLYITSTTNNLVEKIVEGTGVVTVVAGGGRSTGLNGEADGVGATAAFNYPQGITYAPGMLYVADSVPGTIRAITLATGVVTTIAGSGGRQNVTFPSAKRRGYARRRDTANTIPLLNGPGALATFSGPAGILYDAANNRLIVTDQFNDVVRQILL